MLKIARSAGKTTDFILLGHVEHSDGSVALTGFGYLY